MATLTPEGISPRFSSIVSPDIPGSFRLEWTFRPASSTDKQTKAVIELFNEGVLTAFKTVTVTGDENTYELSNLIDVVWEQNQAYEWRVKTYNAQNVAHTSIKGKFYYAESPAVDPVVWSSGPEAYEYLGARTYFSTIAQNALIVMSDYQVDSAEEIALYNDIVENLFQGDIVPSREDFLFLERVIQFLYKKDAFAYKSSSIPDVDRMIEDGLGANDIHKVYELFNEVMKKIPQAPQAAVISVGKVSMPTITDISFISSGDEDASVQVIWDAGEIIDKTGTITLTGLSESEDIRYYYCEYSYGNADSPYTSKMYYRPEDLANINNTITFELRYADLFTASTIGKASHEIAVTAVDVRGNESNTYHKAKREATGFKSPIQISYYEVEFERGALTADNPNPSAKYLDLYKGLAFKATHKLAKNQQGVYFYRARVVDITGLMSGWTYTDVGNTFDPLKPPPAPKNFKATTTYEEATLTWSRAPTADNYEWKRGSSGTVHDTKSPTGKATGLNEGSTYTYYLRAQNRAGSSPWVSIKAKQKVRPPVTTERKSIGADCWRTPYRGFNGGWRTESWDSGRKELIQGMWIELHDGYNTDGDWVRKGTTYGNHKSLIFIDHDYWEDKLRGKEILSVKIFLQRKSTQHGYPNDGRYIKVWTHNYSSRPKGEPSLARGTEINTNFRRGQGHYVKLPTSWGELLRDGKIKGFALHAPFRTTETHKYTYCRFDESKIYLNITYK